MGRRYRTSQEHANIITHVVVWLFVVFILVVVGFIRYEFCLYAGYTEAQCAFAVFCSD